MKEEEIRRLVKIVEESDIDELVISKWWTKVRISKYKSNYTNHHHPVAPPPVSPSPVAEQAPAEAPAAPAAPETPKVAEAEELIEIRSPMVGTFYRAPAPDADPYVEVGDDVTPGQVLCIIEAMKLMNEIESEHSGRIVEICVENGQPVEYNQVLFRLKKI
jgi:acetyl-CoA carboxylase biotin carboxyl carrier protein